jgi:hypothetical protein
MKIHSAQASQVDDLTTFYRITDYGGLENPADNVVFASD